MNGSTCLKNSRYFVDDVFQGILKNSRDITDISREGRTVIQMAFPCREIIIKYNLFGLTMQGLLTNTGMKVQLITKHETTANDSTWAYILCCVVFPRIQRWDSITHNDLVYISYVEIIKTSIWTFLVSRENIGHEMCVNERVAYIAKQWNVFAFNYYAQHWLPVSVSKSMIRIGFKLK